ncbi:SHOCT domain-containing protein [Mycolicibacterium hodleri]|uniref:SHOCT domain-containing protein n=1 Tax=Mycolicibacterium hodleri TaxID=49897 RepID=A0A502EI11_9MYCO|nr:SHOCT domain-containing protein [Mycolicibacterium hodleri]TPG37117.1 SHOCT domain-containing protein [Mycolicibacterium hodleri]
MKSLTWPRILTFGAVLTMVAAGIGFVLVLILNAFVFDEYDAYGEVPIPGSSSLQLPAGDATVTFRTVLIGGSGSGLPVPPLKYRITGPGGVDAQLTEDYGTTTTVNNDARVRIGYLHVPVEGTYDVELDGNVSAYLNPMLAFGHGSNYGHLPWIFAAIFGVAAVDLVIVRIWAARVGRSEQVAPTWTAGEYVPPPVDAVPTFTSSDDGIRVQTLDTLARLRDSGALTKDEYEAEKKRVLEGF